MKQEENMIASVAIVGRPNVGKSTLFNILSKKNLAIVHSSPGVTRDWQEAAGSLSDLNFTIIDTPGIDKENTKNLLHNMLEQVKKVLSLANIIIFVIDSKEGITFLDQKISSLIRKFSKPTILLTNKCENLTNKDELYDIYRLGFDKPIIFSAAHKQGLSELYSQLSPHIKNFEKKEIIDINSINLAIIGRPNAGKSTLVNNLICEERLLTESSPGTTRDSISIKWQFKDKTFFIVDTAGLRKKSKITEKIEKFSIKKTLNTIKSAQITLLIIDAQENINKQDLNIINYVINEGKPILIAINKWDLIKKEKSSYINEFEQKLKKSLSQIKGVPFVAISAKKDHNFDTLLNKIITIFNLWSKKITTPQLNRWIKKAININPPPLSEGKHIKIRYITQTKTKPPTFALFTNKPKKITDNYLRYLLNSLREEFNLPAIPIRMLLKKTKNPYI